MTLIVDLLIEGGEQHNEADPNLVRESIKDNERVHVYVYHNGADVAESGINLVHENAKFVNVCLGSHGDDDPNNEWMDPLIEAAKKDVDSLLEAIDNINDKDRTKVLDRRRRSFDRKAAGDGGQDIG